MPNKLSRRQGVTLLEMMIGAIIIAVISLAGWVSVSAMSRSGEMSRNLVTGVNLLQQSQEEVRRIAQVEAIFDTLENCDFPPDNAPKLTCGLKDLSGEYAGFSRTLQVSTENGSTELKRVLVTIQWRELGQDKQRQSVALLSRPPQPLAGNLKGLVCSEDEDQVPFGGIRVELDANTSTASYSTSSVNVVDDDGANYNFADFDTGRFIVPAGTYTLTVDDSRFQPYTHPTPVIIPSNGEEIVNFCLEPKPDEAVIFGDVIDQTTGNPVGTFNRGRINLYRDGRRLQRISNRRNYSFTIAFTDTNPQTFTVNTHDAFRLGYAYAVGGGGTPSCQYLFNREGYSTAVVQPDFSLVCSNPYNGNSAVDRIEVYPGDNLKVDLPVVPVPEVLINGRVVDSNGQAVANATVRARWPRSDGSYDWRKGNTLQTVMTDGNGDFTFSVPAVQGLFANNSPGNNFLQVWARGTVSVMTCCDVLRNVQRDSQLVFAGPLYPGDTPRDIGTLVISSQDQDCGNVGGIITDDFSGNTLPGVNVNISAIDITDGMGEYLMECAAGQSGYRLPTRNYRFTSIRGGYYTNQSVGNSQYTRRGSSGYDVGINTATTTNYDARMWPRGFANITVTVFDQTTGQPMEGVTVVFDPYFGSNVTQTTSGGVVTFNNVPETWPPPGLPNDGYYRLNVSNHRIQINHDPANYQPYEEVIQDLEAGETMSITVFLRRNGGV